MEIFAQWLDDLDDACAALPLLWERLRFRCLQAGFLAAMALACTNTSPRPLVFASLASGVALAAVLVWIGSVAHAVGRRVRRDVWGDRWVHRT